MFLYINSSKITQTNLWRNNTCEIQELNISVLLTLPVPRPASSTEQNSNYWQKKKRNQFKMHLVGTKKYLF